MDSSSLELYATISLALFCLIGAFDGVYYHYYRFRLYKYLETKREHYIHGYRGLVFTPIALLFFVFNTSGVLYLLGLGFLALDTALEVYDILVEKDARAIFGGTPKGETISHVLATSFRIIALGFIIAGKPFGNLLEVDLTPPLFSNMYLVILGSGFAILSLLGGLSHFLPVRRISFSEEEANSIKATDHPKSA